VSLWDQLSDQAREALVVHIVGELPRSRVPEHLREGLVRYFADGILPGSFLQAVLVNDLMSAVMRADPFSLVSVGHIAAFLVDHAPAGAWGSREAVLAWTTTPSRLEV